MTSFNSRVYRADSVASYVRPFQLPFFHPAADAPFNKMLRCQARDGVGPYLLPMLCIRTETGWISAKTRTPLHVQVIGWKYA